MGGSGTYRLQVKLGPNEFNAEGPEDQGSLPAVPRRNSDNTEA